MNTIKRFLKSLGETRRFLALVIGGILGVMIFAVIAAAIFFPNEKVVGNLGWYYLSSLPGFMFYTIGIRGLVGAVVAFVQSWIMMRAMNVCTWNQLKEKLELDSNASHITFLEAFGVGSMALAASAPLTSAYILNVCFWGGAAILLALIITLIALYKAGVRSLAQYREWVDKPHNDNYAKAFRAIYWGIMFLTMMAGR